MKKATLIILPFVLAACATNGDSIANNANISTRLGKIVEKQTVVQQVVQNDPLPVGLGIGFGGWGGGHFGGGFGVNLGSVFGGNSIVSTVTVYQYKIEVAKNDYLLIQSDQNLSPEQCVTIYELANNPNFPKITANTECKLPIPVTSPPTAPLPLTPI